MSDSDYDGEDLLKVFKELNVSLQNVSPNVIKAWFDTDDKNLKHLLTWMCTSLSKENFLSALENSEFLELEAPLVDNKYEREMKIVEDEYPGIFDVDVNELEIELLQDEINLALEEEKHLDELIKINEMLQNNLSKDLTVETEEEIKTTLKLKSTQELCNSLGEKIDEVNEKLHKQLEKYGSNLYNFEFAPVPNFISNMDVEQYQEVFSNVTAFLTPLLETEFHTFNASRSVTLTANQTYLDSMNATDSTSNTLNTMKNRIIQSHQNYVITKIEVEKSKEIMNYLNNTDIDSILYLTENIFTQLSREAKEDTKRRMCGMLDNISVRLAEHQIAQTKYKYAQQELQLYRENLDSLKKIEDIVLKFLSQYFLLSILYNQEKMDIDSSDNFFRKILHYISKDLQSCILRTEKMNKIIQEYMDYKSKDISEKSKMIGSIVRILTNKQNFDLHEAMEAVGEFKTELDRLETKAFCSDFYDSKRRTEELRRNINILQSFLFCGPTHRIIILSPELQQLFNIVENHLKKQVAAIKAAVEISSSMKKIPNKWQNYRRQLWMYFYTDPKKMFKVLQEVEEMKFVQECSKVVEWM